MHRIFAIALALMAAPLTHAQTVAARANLTWQLPTQYIDNTAIPAGALTKVQVWASTAPLLDGALGTPVAVLPGTATSYDYAAQVPNGSTLYFRLKACTATVCSATTPQMSKSIKIDIPQVPAGVSVTVTVTLSGP